jgi:hypothetical protein
MGGDFAWRHHRDLFQGRYGAELINDESGMIVVSRYIH